MSRPPTKWRPGYWPQTHASWISNGVEKLALRRQEQHVSGWVCRSSGGSEIQRRRAPFCLRLRAGESAYCHPPHRDGGPRGRLIAIKAATGCSRLLECRGASILQLDLGRVGGLFEAKKIAAMAETKSAQIAPHLYSGPVVAAANIHLSLSCPNFLILESIGRFEGPYMSVVTGGFEWQDGFVLPPKAPGLGVELNDAVIAANAAKTSSTLHQELKKRIDQ
ncbi:enolase C-terminal domain-like protein [Roseobacter sp. HKCCD8198]|uniref:enolase C-terminal domain-like protein n=1 Tax=unclassified Roseobacter TaxID=196798 RepID=UPI00345F6927